MTNLNTFDAILARGLSDANLFFASEKLACLISLRPDGSGYEISPIDRIVTLDGAAWAVGGSQFALSHLLQPGQRFKKQTIGAQSDESTTWTVDAVSMESIEGQLLLLGFLSETH